MVSISHKAISYAGIIQKLQSLSDAKVLESMIKFRVDAKNKYGVSIPQLRKIAKEIGVDHTLAQELWASGIHEARTLASMIDDPEMVTERQMESWSQDFDSWAICDECCGNLFDKTIFAYQKAIEWSKREEEYVKRAAFTLMAALAIHDKEASDDEFIKFLPIIKAESTDDRNFVRKAVNWALRQIGKRNLNLNKIAIKTAEEISQINSKSARWIASDAIRELTSEAVQNRLAKAK